MFRSGNRRKVFNKTTLEKRRHWNLNPHPQSEHSSETPMAGEPYFYQNAKLSDMLERMG